MNPKSTDNMKHRIAILMMAASASCSSTPTQSAVAKARGKDYTIAECSMRHSQYVDGIRSATTQDALDEYSSKAHKERQAMLYEMSYLSSNGEITQEQAQEWYRSLKASALNEETAYKEAARRVMASESGRSIQ